jgi:hypothetical protein
MSDHHMEGQDKLAIGRFGQTPVGPTGPLLPPAG